MARLLYLNLLIVVYFFPVLVMGQEPYKQTVDSLYQNFKKLKFPTEKDYEVVRYAIYDLSDNGLHKEAETAAFKFLKLTEKKGSVNDQALLHHVMAYNYKKMGQFETAISFYEKSIALRKKVMDEKGVSKAFNNIGNIYYDLGNYEKSIEAHSKSLTIKKKLGDIEGVAISLTGIGNVLSDQKRHLEALEYFRQSLLAGLKINDSTQLASVHTNIGLEKQHLKDYDSARYYFKKSLEYSKPIAYHYMAGFALEGIGSSYLNEGDYDSAEKYLKESLSVRTSINSPLEIVLTKLELARLYHLINKPDKGSLLAEEALKLSKDIQFLKGEQLANNYLSKAYEKKGNYKKALDYQKAFKNLTDSLFTIEEHKAINLTNNKIKVEQETYEVRLKQSEQRALFTTSLTFILLAFILLTTGFFYSRKKQKQKNELVLKLKELEVEQRILVSAQNERKKISQDLHDDLSNTISAIKLVVTNSYSNDKILLKMVEKANKDVRDFFTRITQSDSKNNQLSRVIKTTIKNLNHTGKLIFEYIEVGDESLIPDNFVRPLSLIATELMMNVAKHAQASQCTIQLIIDDDEVQLMIEDNGKGFDPKTKKKGMGIDNIYDRVDRWNGKVHISGGTTGTTTIIKIPLNKNNIKDARFV